MIYAVVLELFCLHTHTHNAGLTDRDVLCYTTVQKLKIGHSIFVHHFISVGGSNDSKKENPFTLRFQHCELIGV